MALSYKWRRRLSLLALLVGLPMYIAGAWYVTSLFDRPPMWLELLIYIVLGFLWIVPLKPVFLGVGKPDPDADKKAGE